ncbi:MAG: acyl carrier protein [Lachnospiraceae bacterium]|nr:acyl carrier protein [Lachnospiraceae bacterium]
MDREEVFSKVADICKEVFDDESLEVTETSSAKDIEAWDSLTHLDLISALEDTFQVSFTLEEFSGAKNLGELVNYLMKHLSE